VRALGETAAAGWPISATLAVALLSQSVRVGRRRQAINRALHELRRPLHALALAAPGAPPSGSLDLAFVALAQLDAEVNGPDPEIDAGPGRCRTLVEGAVARWGGRAALAGGSIEVNWRGPDDARVLAPAAVAQAIDNLVVNAIEHGGSSIVLDVVAGSRTVRIRVRDSGRASRPDWRSETPAETVARLTGKRRRGHGLAVVRRLARAQGGRFFIQRSERGSVAALELPLAGRGDRMRAA
jgi:hypothetical protein